MKQKLLLASLAIVPAFALAQSTEPDYSAGVGAAKDSIAEQLTNVAPALFALMAILVGIRVVFKLVKRASS